MGGLVELDGALGILAEHAVDDTDVEMEASVQKDRDRAEHFPRHASLAGRAPTTNLIGPGGLPAVAAASDDCRPGEVAPRGPFSKRSLRCKPTDLSRQRGVVPFRAAGSWRPLPSSPLPHCRATYLVNAPPAHRSEFGPSAA